MHVCNLAESQLLQQLECFENSRSVERLDDWPLAANACVCTRYNHYLSKSSSCLLAALVVHCPSPEPNQSRALRNQELTCRMDVVLARHMMDRSRLTAVCVTSARMHGSLKSQD